MATWYVENKWTCSSCSTENLGRHVRCEKCGSPKETHEKDRMPDGTPQDDMVTDLPLLELAQQGPHWVCQYCGSKQRAPEGGCASCGAGRPTPTPPPPTRPKRDPLPREISPLPVFKAPERSPHVFYLGAVAIVLVLILGGIWLFTAHEVMASVVGMKWIHTARYEERLTRKGEGWDAPIGAFNKTCRRKQRGTENCRPRQCNCRTRTDCRDQGNGFSKCTESVSCSTCYDQCPVYDDWCRYSYYDWVPRGDRTFDGDDPKTMQWPDLGKTDETHRTLRVSAYIVHFKSDDDTYSFNPETPEQFSIFEVGQRWACQYRRVGLFRPLKRVD